jgi:DHA1 family multidrug resistance protein-like MFS transporter
VLLAGDGVAHLGYGVFAPYVALYLTGPIGASNTATGLVLAAWGLVGLLTAPFGGLLSDRLGRRPLILGGLAGSAFCAFAFYFASSVWVLLLLVPLWGLCFSMMRPAMRAYVVDVVDPELRVEAFGIDRLVSNAAFALGPPLGALVITLASLRDTFLVTAVTELCFLAIALRWLPESRPAATVSEEPPRLSEALRDRRLLVLALGTALAWFLFAVYDEVFGVFLHQERGLAISTWGLLFTINPVLVVLTQYPVARWASGRSARLVLAAGALLNGLAVFLLLPFTGITVVVVSIVLLTGGEVLLAPVSSALAGALSPEHLRGAYQAVLDCGYGAASMPAVALGLFLVGRGDFGWLLGAAPLIAVAAVAFFSALPGKGTDVQPVVEAV